MDGINTIEFTIDGDHIIQSCGGMITIFPDGDITSPGVEIDVRVMSRIIKIVEGNIEDPK